MRGIMKVFTAVTGNGSSYKYIAEHMEVTEKYFHFIVDGKIIGVKEIYGVVAITDQPYDQRYV